MSAHSVAIPAAIPACGWYSPGYLRRVRGAVADPQRIVICAGYAQGLNLALRVLARGGARRGAVEDPGHPETRETAEYLGRDVRGSPVAAAAYQAFLVYRLEAGVPRPQGRLGRGMPPDRVPMLFSA